MVYHIYIYTMVYHPSISWINGYPWVSHSFFFRDLLAEPHGEETRRQVFSLEELAEIEVGLGRAKGFADSEAWLQSRI